MFEPEFFDAAFFVSEGQPVPEPEPTPQYPEDGPWIAHGVVHLKFPPVNH